MSLLLLLSTASAEDPCSMESISVYVQGGWTPAQVKEICPDFGSSSGSQTKREVVTPSASELLCPTKLTGDDDLVRNIRTQLDVALTHDTKILRSKTTLAMSDEESGSNHTTASGEWRGVLYTAPEGWIITGLDSAASGSSVFIDENGATLNTHPLDDANFFAAVTSMGETEHSGDLAACDESHASLRYTLGPVIVVLQKE